LVNKKSSPVTAEEIKATTVSEAVSGFTNPTAEIGFIRRCSPAPETTKP
jgi:hypothetical protein